MRGRKNADSYLGYGAAGLLSTAYLVLAMPIIIVWKIFRKVKYHIAICD